MNLRRKTDVRGILWLLGYNHRCPINHILRTIVVKSFTESLKSSNVAALANRNRIVVNRSSDFTSLRSAYDVEAVIKVAKDLRYSDDATVLY